MEKSERIDKLVLVCEIFREQYFKVEFSPYFNLLPLNFLYPLFKPLFFFLSVVILFNYLKFCVLLFAMQIDVLQENVVKFRL